MICFSHTVLHEGQYAAGDLGGQRAAYQKLRKLAAMRSSSGSSTSLRVGTLVCEREARLSRAGLATRWWDCPGLLGCEGVRWWVCVVAIWGGVVCL